MTRGSIYFCYVTSFVPLHLLSASSNLEIRLHQLSCSLLFSFQNMPRNYMVATVSRSYFRSCVHLGIFKTSRVWGNAWFIDVWESLQYCTVLCNRWTKGRWVILLVLRRASPNSAHRNTTYFWKTKTAIIIVLKYHYLLKCALVIKAPSSTFGFIYMVITIFKVL